MDLTIEQKKKLIEMSKTKRNTFIKIMYEILDERQKQIFVFYVQGCSIIDIQINTKIECEYIKEVIELIKFLEEKVNFSQLHKYSKQLEKELLER